MELIQKLKSAESIVIEGEKKVGKTTLGFYISKVISEKSSFVCPLATYKVIKKIESAANSFDNFVDLKEFLNLFAIREDWVDIKNEYGYTYLLKDLEKFISHQESDVIIINKIGAFFDYSDRDFIDDFLSQLLSYGITYKKKLIFTLDSDDTNYDMISGHLVDNSDFYLKLFVKDSQRIIDVLYSLVPMDQKEFLYTNENSNLVLKSKSVTSGENKNISILVISSDPYLQKLHKYLLGKDGIELTVVDCISDSLSCILRNPDFLIFGQEDEKVNLSICEIAKEHKINTNILYLAHKDFVRVDDRIKAKELGCIDMIKLDDNVMNYILELEKYFNLVFYKNSSSEHSKVYYAKDEFVALINDLVSKKEVFTLTKVNEALGEEDLNAMREYDKVFVADDYSIIITLNTLKNNITNILEKKFNRSLDMLAIEDSVDVFFKGLTCID